MTDEPFRAVSPHRFWPKDAADELTMVCSRCGRWATDPVHVDWPWDILEEEP